MNFIQVYIICTHHLNVDLGNENLDGYYLTSWTYSFVPNYFRGHLISIAKMRIYDM